MAAVAPIQLQPLEGFEADVQDDHRSVASDIAKPPPS
jgi:hypothetical protein